MKKALRTQEQLQNALLELLETKELKEITVKEICEKAGISRNTDLLTCPETADSIYPAVLTCIKSSSIVKSHPRKVHKKFIVLVPK